MQFKNILWYEIKIDYKKFAKISKWFDEKITRRSIAMSGTGTTVWMCHTRGWVTGLICSVQCATGTHSGRVHSLPWGMAMQLFPNDFGRTYFECDLTRRCCIKYWRFRFSKLLSGITFIIIVNFISFYAHFFIFLCKLLVIKKDNKFACILLSCSMLHHVLLRGCFKSEVKHNIAVVSCL